MSTVYTPRNGWIEGKNLPCFSNRYIYKGNTSVYIMAGDRPLIRLAENRKLLGTLRLFYREKPLEDFEQILMRYRPGRVQWILSDPAAEGEIRLEVTSPGDGLGMILKVEADEELSFLYGGIREVTWEGVEEPPKFWNLSVRYTDKELKRIRFCDSWLEGNRAEWIKESGSGDANERGQLVLSGPDSDRCVYIQSDREVRIVDSQAKDVDKAAGCQAKDMEKMAPSGCQAAGKIGKFFGACLAAEMDLEKAFWAGVERSERIAGRLQVNTPDEYINTACAVAAGEVDGSWHPPKTMHGNMSWSMPLLGWQVHYGHHMLGNHDRAKALLRAYYKAQNRSDEKTGYEMDETYTIPGKNSRFYGKGHIDEDQSWYNMQTQFFHQMISAWRFSGDEEFAAILREMLELHLEWEEECFDPEGTGVYASVLNTWPTDSVSYSDGGAVEETCYAYAAQRAMAELVRTASGSLRPASNDAGQPSASVNSDVTSAGQPTASANSDAEGQDPAEKYERKADRIKKAFFEELWIPDKGYPATYRDRGGRRHEESWIYSSFMPVECGLLDPFEQAQTLYYPQWAYERGEDGGFWFSNWTPGIWSVRENAGGENMQQACAFLKGGKDKEAMEIIQKAARSYLDSDIPGEMMHPIIETAHQFTRVMVEGLFGYRPDYPNGKVTVTPMLPFEWKKADMETGDVSIQWEIDCLRVKLKRPAELTVRMRLFAEELLSVKGVQEWHLEPGIGGMTVVMKVGCTDSAYIELETRGERDWLSCEETDRLPVGEDIYNPQGIDETMWGEHVAFRKMPEGYFREIHVHLGPDRKAEELREKQRTPLPEKPAFENVDISGAFNADVQHIFKNEYLSPRPKKGCYAQIGKDGYSFWTFPFWQIQAPDVVLSQKGLVKSGDGIPFEIAEKRNNIVFASYWDNFPTSVEVPVISGEPADMAALLIAGSTSPMQCGIENARITFLYEDGTAEELPLVNPDNYIMLCPYHDRATSSGSEINRSDVFNPVDISLMKNFTPEIIELGENLRALSIRWPLAPGKTLKSLRLTVCSNDIVVGLMGLTLIKGWKE